MKIEKICTGPLASLKEGVQKKAEPIVLWDFAGHDEARAHVARVWWMQSIFFWGKRGEAQALTPTA